MRGFDCLGRHSSFIISTLPGYSLRRVKLNDANQAVFAERTVRTLLLSSSRYSCLLDCLGSWSRSQMMPDIPNHTSQSDRNFRTSFSMWRFPESWGYPQSSSILRGFSWIFPYTPSILGVPPFMETPESCSSKVRPGVSLPLPEEPPAVAPQGTPRSAVAGWNELLLRYDI